MIKSYCFQRKFILCIFFSNISLDYVPFFEQEARFFLTECYHLCWPTEGTQLREKRVATKVSFCDFNLFAELACWGMLCWGIALLYELWADPISPDPWMLCWLAFSCSQGGDGVRERVCAGGSSGLVLGFTLITVTMPPKAFSAPVDTCCISQALTHGLGL